MRQLALVCAALAAWVWAGGVIADDAANADDAAKASAESRVLDTTSGRGTR